MQNMIKGGTANRYLLNSYFSTGRITVTGYNQILVLTSEFLMDLEY